MRCKFCKRESSARKPIFQLFIYLVVYNSNKIFFNNSIEFDTSPITPYTIENSGNFAQMAIIECRGLEFVDFEPRVNIQKIFKILLITCFTHAL